MNLSDRLRPQWFLSLVSLHFPDENLRALTFHEWNHQIVVQALQRELILEVWHLKLALRGHLSHYSIEILIRPQQGSHVKEWSEVLVVGSCLIQKVLVSWLEIVWRDGLWWVAFHALCRALRRQPRIIIRRPCLDKVLLDLDRGGLREICLLQLVTPEEGLIGHESSGELHALRHPSVYKAWVIRL
jgi:hypothetical protein